MDNIAQRTAWAWLMTLGIILIIIGLLALSSPFVTTITSALVFGFFLIFADITQIISAFVSRKSQNFLINLLIGILAVVVGALMLRNPAATVITLTLLIAGFFLGVGIFRILSAIMLRFEGWGWILFNGIISFILGILIVIHWPSSGLWVIGLFIGIDLLLAGWSLVMNAWHIRELSTL